MKKLSGAKEMVLWGEMAVFMRSLKMIDYLVFIVGNSIDHDDWGWADAILGSIDESTGLLHTLAVISCMILIRITSRAARLHLPP